MVLGPAPVLKRWPSGQGGLLLWGQDLGEVGQDQQSQMCRWPEVLLLVGQCSEEPVVTLQAKKTRTALICTCTCVQIVQRQLYSACCYIASCTVDLRTTQTYGSYVLIFQDKTCSNHSFETVRRCPREVATVSRTLKLTLKNLSEVVEVENNKSSKSRWNTQVFNFRRATRLSKWQSLVVWCLSRRKVCGRGFWCYPDSRSRIPS